MNRYTFPFGSCEKPQTKGGIAQPYSTSINIILCLIILTFMLQSNNLYSRLFLFTILVFNGFHTLSHTIHIKELKNYQFLLTHYSSVISTFFLIAMLNYITKEKINKYILCLLVLLYGFDTYLIIKNVSHIYNIIIFMVILFIILIYYYPFLTKKMQTNIFYIIISSSFVLFFQLFEIANCKYILENYNFPFHIITEISASIPIALLCYTFYKL
jgi:hypothetical protein